MFKTHVVHISDRVMHDGLSTSVFLPGVMGEFEVSDTHVPIAALLTSGPLLVELPRGRKGTSFWRAEPGIPACIFTEYQGRYYKKIEIAQGIMHFDGTQLLAVLE